MEYHFYLDKQVVDNLLLFRLGYLEDILFSWKMSEVTTIKTDSFCCLWYHLSFQEKIKNLENFIGRHNWDSFPIFEDFLHEIGGDFNDCDF